MRFVVFLSVVLSIWLLEHLYVGWRLLSLPAFDSPAARRWLIVVMGYGFFAYIGGRMVASMGWRIPAALLEYSGALWMGVVFLLLAAFFLVDVATLGGFVLRAWVPTLRTAAVVCALLAAATAWVSGWAGPRVVNVEVEAGGLARELDGTSILQVSDLHLGPMIGTRRLDRILEVVEETRPDIVAVTGDLVDGDAAAVKPLLPTLRRIQAPLGVFAVLGNHEYYAGPDRSREILKNAGFTVLNNASEEVAPGIVVAGVPDARGASQVGSDRADLGKALSGVNGDAAIVLLQHSPGDENEAAAAGVDVMLNGHTHGGQIWPFHHLVARAYPHYAGVRHVGGMTQVVSRGAGLWGPPMRLFAPSDVVLVTLRSADAGSS